MDACHRSPQPLRREVLYGYPYLIGRRAGKAIRAPLLTIPVRIEPHRDGFVVHPADDVARFNSLPFRADEEAPVREDAIGRVLEDTPSFPVQKERHSGRSWTFSVGSFRGFVERQGWMGNWTTLRPAPAGSRLGQVDSEFE